MKRIDFLILSLIGALSAHGILALSLISNDFIPFFLFFVSSICGIFAGVQKNNKSILFINLGFLSLNCLEILRVL
jgi:hypothetical protein